MAGGKYGRLFTERDAALLVGMAYSVGWRDGARYAEQGFRARSAPTCRDELDELLAHVLERTVRHYLTFPADEPLFLLRGQDKVARLTILDYCGRARVARGSGRYGEDSFADDVTAAAEAMREWQATNPDRVKAPD